MESNHEINSTVIYALYDKQCLREFLRSPDDFIDASIDIKEPRRPEFDAPRFEKVDLSDTMTYLQMSTSTALQHALAECSDIRPIYPNKTAKESALLFVAKHLRAHNPLRAKWITQKSETKLNEFLRRCGLPDIITRQMDVCADEASTSRDVQKLNELIAELRSVPN